MFLKTDGAGNLSFDSLSFSTPLAVIGNATSGSEIRLPEDTDNGSNYVALKAPDTIASNLTLTLPSADGSSGQVLQTNGSGVLSFVSGGGKVLQVVSGSYASQASTTSTTFQDLSSDTNVSITCSSASNKVLIIAHFNECYLNGSHCLWIRITAGGSEIIKSECVLFGPSGERLHNQNITFLYSPNSTSSIQYKMQFKSNNGSNVRINQNSSVGGSSLTLMEIAG